MVSNTRKFIGLLLITVTMVTGSLIYSANQEVPDESSDKPPTFDIEISRSRLIGQLNGDSCTIPGYKFTTDDAASFDPPEGVPEVQKYKLESGVHLYHADTEMTVAQIKSMIVPEPDNKIMILHYNPVNNAGKKFSLYPPLNSDKVVSINDPSAYRIPANQGIIIVSCEETDIWKVKSETKRGVGAPAGLDQITDNWVLIAGSDRLALNGYNITAVYPQNGPGFDFPENVAADTLSLGPYSMIWLRISPEQGDEGGGNPVDPDPADGDATGIDGYATLPLVDPEVLAATNLTSLDVVKKTDGAHDRIQIFKDGNYPAHWGIIGYDGHENDFIRNPQRIMPATVVKLNDPASYNCPSPAFVIEGRAACPPPAADPNPLNLTCTVNSVAFLTANDPAQTASFTASSNEDRSIFTQGQFDLRWNFGDNTPVISDIEPPTTHAYAAGGQYDVTVTLTTTDGRSGVATCADVNIAAHVAAAADRFSALPVVDQAILSNADLHLVVGDVVKTTDVNHYRVKIFKDASNPANPVHWGYIGAADGRHDNDYLEAPLSVNQALLDKLNAPANYSGDAPALIVEGREIDIVEAPQAVVLTCTSSVSYVDGQNFQRVAVNINTNAEVTNEYPLVVNFGDGFFNTYLQKNVTYQYQSEGNYPVSVSKSVDGRMLNADCGEVNIERKAAPLPAIGVCTVEKSGRTASYLLQVPRNALLYDPLWDFGDGSQLVQGTEIGIQDHTYSHAGNYDTTVTLLNNGVPVGTSDCPNVEIR